MEIHYDSNKLAKRCESVKAIRKHFPNQADRILARLQDLIDYPNLKEYLDCANGGNPHPLRENLKGWFWVHVNGPNVIIFECLGEIPLSEDELPDYSQVTDVNILYVNEPETKFKK